MSKNKTAQMDPAVGIVRSPNNNRQYWYEDFHLAPGINADVGTTYANADATNAANLTITTARVIANPAFEILGTNAVSANSVPHANGGCAITTAGASADQIYVLPHQDAGRGFNTTEWDSDEEIAVEFAFSLSSVAACDLFVGFLPTGGGTTTVPATFEPGDAADGAIIFFASDTNSGRFQLVVNYGSSTETLSLGSAYEVAASTEYVVQVYLDAARKAHFFIDGQDVGVSENAVDSNQNLLPTIGIEATAAAAKTAVVRYIALGKNKA